MAATMGAMSTPSSSARPSSRCWRWIGRWAEAAEHLQLALDTVDELPAGRLRPERARLSPPRPGSRCTAVTGTRRTGSSRGRCEPGRPARFVLPHGSPCAYACNWPRCTRRPRRPGDRASPPARDRRHLAPPAGSGSLVDQVSELRGILTSSAQITVAGGPPPQPSGASAAPLPADPPHVQADRGAAVRVSQHRQLRSRLDLSKTGRLLTQRRGAASDDGRPARRVAEVTRRTLFQGIVDVVAQRHRQTRRRRDNAGSPTTETTPSSTSTISAAVAPALTAASTSAP